MLFNTFFFILFFPLVFVLYYSLQEVIGKSNKKRCLAVRNLFLILTSYLVYIKYNPAYALVLLYVTLATYCSAIVIERKRLYKQGRIILPVFVILAVIPLVVFKYSGFIADTFNSCLGLFGIEPGLKGLNMAIPLGISFFTLQALGYLLDVYNRKIKAERNFCDYTLFVSFFPQIASGPISKAADLLPQVKELRRFNYEETVQGLKWLLWGFFMKLVVADRIGLFVDKVFSEYATYSGSACFIYSLFYAMQIYCDFAGYSFMAIGVGAMLGFKLVNNFRRPYLSASVTEFWHRWHISLSVWLKDYVYIPLGGNRCGKSRNYYNILMTFIVSGIWHGANWTFIVWGFIHGLYQIVEKFFNVQKPTGKSPVYKAFRIMLTFLLVSFAWIFFRMPTLDGAAGFIRNIFTDWDWSFSLPGKIVLIFLLIVVIKDLTDEYFPKLNPFYSRWLIVRWLTYLFFVMLIALFGVFDSGQFIYARF